ncbi:MAG TPA: DUF1992 domain-containing protein [Pyrinomonadaceae bacterium]|jgi:hypothetical protein|nr:DUF1992 domain-containing protein [Pyrinomonadaceae bacterium]
MARGDFDNLKGKGQPLDLDSYFTTPDELRMAHSILKSNDFVPEEVEMLNDIARLKSEIKACVDDTRRSEIASRLREKQLAVTIALEKYRRRK